MLKYEGRVEWVCCGIVYRVVKEGTPLDGRHVFRNKNAQKLFDEMREGPYVQDYGIDSDGDIYFLALNGVVRRYTRREFIKLANEAD